LTIAFKNLIDNACKFSDEEVLIEFLIMQKIIKVSIEDKGIGIPHDELDSICSPFKRASNVKFKAGLVSDCHWFQGFLNFIMLYLLS
jgi:signal transduction histidine kinase